MQTATSRQTLAPGCTCNRQVCQPPFRTASLKCCASTAERTAEQPSTSRKEDIWAWAARMGVRSKALSVADFQGLRGLRAGEEISAGEALASLPLTAALVVKPKMACPAPQLCSEAYWSSAPWYVKMALLLLREQILGENSNFAAYIQQLPSRIPVPMNWSDAQIVSLGYPHLVKEVRQQQAKWAEAYDKYRASRQGDVMGDITRDNFFWALQNVRSRAFSGPYGGPSWRSRIKTAAVLAAAGGASLQFAHLPLEQVLNGAIAAVLFNILYDVILSQKVKWYAMLPVVDFANHSSSVKSSVEYEYFTDRFSVSCSRPFKEGEQVLISYGDQSNDSLLQYYGFVEADNPHDTYVISPPGTASEGIKDDSLVVVTRQGVAEGHEASLLKLCGGRDMHKVLLGLCENELIKLRRAKEPGKSKSPEAALASKYKAQKEAVLLACMQACRR